MLAIPLDEYTSNGHRGQPEPGRVAVVTGAAGFIGSHLVDLLLDRGHSVIGLDSLDPAYSPVQKRANLAAAEQHPSFRLVVDDLRRADLAGLFQGSATVYHLAARAGVQDSWRPGVTDTWDVNVAGTQAVLEAALAAGAGRVVLASSSSVYGETAAPGGPRTVNPISPYGASKAACEHLAGVYSHRGLEVVTLRYFTVFGPRQRPDMAMHRMFEATRPEGPVFSRRGSGEQTREFTFVRDVAEATAAAATVPPAAGMTFDIGGGVRPSLNDVIAAVGAVAGTGVRFRTVPRPAGDPQATAADTGPARQLLGWGPVTPLRRGLAEQAAWHQQRWASGSDRAPQPPIAQPVRPRPVSAAI